jgi:hypothetical protein
MSGHAPGQSAPSPLRQASRFIRDERPHETAARHFVRHGFIGASAIVRRDNLVTGVTTAATLWFLTVIGLCFGAGQIALGLTGAALGVAVLMGLKLIEDRMKQDKSAELVIIAGPFRPG